MSLPKHITYHIYQHYDATEFCTVTLDQNNQVHAFNDKAQSTLQLSHNEQDIRDVLPLLATETLEESFFLPFYNHKSWVFDVHFFAEKPFKYLVLVPVDKFHQQVQFKQQLAHDEELEKMRFKTLFETLEIAQQELIAANKSKSFYISALSHEMGNPLNAISGYNQLLQEGEISLEQATEIIDKNVKKLNLIITQALNYDNQNKRNNQQNFRPHQIIDDLLNDFKPQASNKSLLLKNQVSPSLTVNSSLIKWQQIFTNLISNAIKYTDQGHITVSSKTENQQLMIDVIDSGCGMSQAFQKNLFTAWAREYKSQAHGNGIGLVISKMLAEQINAQLLLHKSDEKGSVFRFVFPLETNNQFKILLVDDDEDCLNLFAYYLSKDQHHVVTATTIESLTHQLDTNPYDVIITDLNLGSQQVTEVFERIKAHVKYKVVITANPTSESREKLLNQGFDQVLAKPINEADLRNSVTNINIKSR